MLLFFFFIFYQSLINFSANKASLRNTRIQFNETPMDKQREEEEGRKRAREKEGEEDCRGRGRTKERAFSAVQT